METKTIIGYGDSNTYGYDPRTGGSGRYNKAARWTGIIEKQLGYTLENHGICGRCIPHTQEQISFAREQIREWSVRDGSLEMWIMLGTNDLLQEPAFTARDAALRMAYFLRQLMKEPAVSSQKIRLLLIAPPRMQHGSWVTEERIYEESAKIGCEYQKIADLVGIPMVDAGQWDIPVLFDGVHFSEEGHRNFAAGLIKTLSSICGLPS